MRLLRPHDVTRCDSLVVKVHQVRQVTQHKGPGLGQARTQACVPGLTRVMPNYAFDKAACARVLQQCSACGSGAPVVGVAGDWVAAQVDDLQPLELAQVCDGRQIADCVVACGGETRVRAGSVGRAHAQSRGRARLRACSRAAQGSPMDSTLRSVSVSRLRRALMRLL